MANVYTQFCEELEVTPWQMLWIKRHVAYMREGPDPHGPDWEEYVAMCRNLNIDGEAGEDGYAFDYEYDQISGKVTFYSDEMGNPEHVCRVVQEMFKAFRLDKCFGIQWSSSSDRCDVDAYCGGAIFVTKDSMEVNDPGMWLEELEESFNWKSDNL